MYQQEIGSENYITTEEGTVCILETVMVDNNKKGSVSQKTEPETTEKSKQGRFSKRPESGSKKKKKNFTYTLGKIL